MRSRVLLTVLAASFLARGATAERELPRGATAERELVDRIVAIIDRDVVLLSEAEQAMRLRELRTDEHSTLAEIVDRLIESRLIEREVARFVDETIPESVVEDRLAEARARFPSDDAFEEMIGQRGLSVEDVRGEIRRQLTINRYIERRFRALTYVNDDDVSAYFDEEILPSLDTEREPTLEERDQIRRLLEEKRFNNRIEQWIDGLKRRAQIRRYIW